MSVDSLKEAVARGMHINEDAPLHALKSDGDALSSYIDLIKYGAVRSPLTWVNPEFLQEFSALNMAEQLEVAATDCQKILSAVIIRNIMHEDYTHWLGNSCIALKEMAQALAIVFNDINVLEGADAALRYHYFVHAEVALTNLQYFSDDEFISSALDKILNEERVIFIWIVKNIIGLIQEGYLDPSKYRAFFKSLFDKYSYIQGEQEVLFLTAVSKDYLLFDELFSVRLSIDPFSKQVDYPLWLRDTAKFRFLEKLRGLEGVSSARYAVNFDRKLITFKELYKFDRSFRDR